MKAPKIVPTIAVRYLNDAAGIKAGTEKSLPVSLAKEMIALGHVEEAEPSAEAVKPTVKEAKEPQQTKELKTRIKTKGK